MAGAPVLKCSVCGYGEALERLPRERYRLPQCTRQATLLPCRSCTRARVALTPPLCPRRLRFPTYRLASRYPVCCAPAGVMRAVLQTAWLVCGSRAACCDVWCVCPAAPAALCPCRIIAGSAAGRTLASSQGSMTRPMMEKVGTCGCGKGASEWQVCSMAYCWQRTVAVS